MVASGARLSYPGLTLRWLALGIISVLVAALAATFVGPVRLDPGAVIAELLDRLPFVTLASDLDVQETAILWELRLPRIVLGGLVGALLALCGAAYQGVFRNPLADPYLLGAAAGAGLGATLALVYGPPPGASPLDPVVIAAFAGALGGVMLAYSVGRAGGRVNTTTALVLAGVAVTSFLTALQTYVQQRESDSLRQVYTWILGRLSTVGWDEVLLALPYAVVSAGAIFLHRRLLDVLSVGDEEADSLGVMSGRVRLAIVAAASLGTAAAVAVSGLIGFVGIIVPHTIRLIAGTSYRVVIPLSIMFGAAFMILTDLIARTVIAPAEVPIGVITAFFGAPFFAVVLWLSRKTS